MEFVYAEMRQFSRRGVFELAKKRQLLLKHSIDRLVDDTLLRFRSLGIPLNGAYCSIYFSVLEKATSYNPLNSSTVIENFVEVLLEKGSIEGLFRTDFDYKNQVHLLSHCAAKEWFALTNIWFLTMSYMIGLRNISI